MATTNGRRICVVLSSHYFQRGIYLVVRTEVQFSGGRRSENTFRGHLQYITASQRCQFGRWIVPITFWTDGIQLRQFH